jgi:hypothetical protein
MNGMKEETPHRLKEYLAEYGRRFPGAWRTIDDFRSEHVKGLPGGYFFRLYLQKNP